jgi:hypothetical protein
MHTSGCPSCIALDQIATTPTRVRLAEHRPVAALRRRQGLGAPAHRAHQRSCPSGIAKPGGRVMKIVLLLTAAASFGDRQQQPRKRSLWPGPIGQSTLNWNRRLHAQSGWRSPQGGKRTPRYSLKGHRISAAPTKAPMSWTAPQPRTATGMAKWAPYPQRDRSSSRPLPKALRVFAPMIEKLRPVRTVGSEL